MTEQHGDTQPHRGCELGDIHFAIHPAEDYSDDPAEAPSPIKLAFMVFDLPRMVEWLTNCRVDPIRGNTGMRSDLAAVHTGQHDARRRAA